MGDFFLEIFGSLRGGALYINNPMSIYRTNHSASWSTDYKVGTNKYLNTSLKMLESLDLLEKDIPKLSNYIKIQKASFLCDIASYYLVHKEKEKFLHYINSSFKNYSFVDNKQRLLYHLRYSQSILRWIYKHFRKSNLKIEHPT